VLTATLAIGPPHLYAQTSTQSPPVSQAPAATFKSGVEVVTVTAAVRDDHGRVVRDLTKADFAVIDSGVARRIQDFYAGDSPVSVAILLDISGSMGVGGNMDRARIFTRAAMRRRCTHSIRSSRKSCRSRPTSIGSVG
jgi:hypothetical protein